MKLVLSTQKYEYLQHLFCNFYHAEKGEIFTKVFPDGEKYQQILTNVENREVVVIGGTITDEDTLELYDIVVGCAQYGAQKIDVIIPYFGYSTMERATKHGEIVKAKNRATLLSSLPQTSLGTRIFLFDLHSEGLSYYFESSISTFHVRANILWKETVLLHKLEHSVISSTDAGRAMWVESFAQELGTDAAFVYKKRLSGSETKVSAVNADVKDKNIMIYDDMIRTGGSLIEAIKSYKASGANRIVVASTHGLMVNHAAERILKAGVETLFLTNSHPNVLELSGMENIEIVDITSCFNDIF